MQQLKTEFSQILAANIGSRLTEQLANGIFHSLVLAVAKHEAEQSKPKAEAAPATPEGQ